MRYDYVFVNDDQFGEVRFCLSKYGDYAITKDDELIDRDTTLLLMIKHKEALCQHTE